MKFFSWIQKEWGRCVNVQADKLLQEHEQNNPQSGEKLWIGPFYRTLHICMLVLRTLWWGTDSELQMSFTPCLLSALTEGSDGERLNTSSWFSAWPRRHLCGVPARPRQLYCLAEQRQVMFNKVALKFESVILQPFNTNRFRFNWRYDWLMLIWGGKQVSDPSGWPIFSPFSSLSLPVSLLQPPHVGLRCCGTFGIWQRWPKWRRITRPFIDFDFRDQRRSCFKKKKEA